MPVLTTHLLVISGGSHLARLHFGCSYRYGSAVFSADSGERCLIFRNLVVYEVLSVQTFAKLLFGILSNKGLVREVYVLSSDRLMLSLKTGYNESFGCRNDRYV